MENEKYVLIRIEKYLTKQNEKKKRKNNNKIVCKRQRNYGILVATI